LVQTARPVASPCHRCEVVRVSRQSLSGLTIALSPASATTPPTACSPPHSLPLCDSALCFVFFLNASLYILRQAAPFPFLPYLPPPSPHPSSLRHIQLCIFLLYLWLHASGGSSADLTTVQLICLRTLTLSALALGRYYFFWTLTQNCSYTSISPFVLLNLLAGP